MARRPDENPEPQDAAPDDDHSQPHAGPQAQEEGGESDSPAFDYAALLSDPALWQTLGPVLKQVVGELVQKEIASRQEELAGQVREALGTELREGLSQINGVVEQAVEKRVEEKAGSVVEQVKAMLGGQNGAHPAHEPEPQPAANGAGDARSQLLSQAIPAIVQGILGGGQKQAGAAPQIGQMTEFANAMGQAMGAMAAPLFNAYSSGQQATMSQLTTLARFGVNPFDQGGQGNAPGGEASPAPQPAAPTPHQ